MFCLFRFLYSDRLNETFKWKIAATIDSANSTNSTNSPIQFNFIGCNHNQLTAAKWNFSPLLIWSISSLHFHWKLIASQIQMSFDLIVNCCFVLIGGRRAWRSPISSLRVEGEVLHRNNLAVTASTWRSYNVFQEMPSTFKK